ncbi:ParA family protein [Geitlerinema sp. PCC 7407]|uniref:ParA family protein n=1 Tax=Geitlerinema sp. PCC 7407 TaxID=1173025 RepID=UPI00029F8BA7|nr:ParA family protein [Geitlerinema sp. PCC 7407]AFY67917.1 CobQ/CobB/MinD/ParA nucleotide binding domain-containing protein [Geitlerinema sp. PCC 7407]
MAHIIATVNMKGGVGKTTLTVNLATCLAKNHGKRVLVVDLDTQISATLSMIPPQEFSKLRKGRRTLKQLIQEVVQPTPVSQSPALESRSVLTVNDTIHPYVATVKGLDLLPGDIDLYDDFLISRTLHHKTVRDAHDNFEQAWNTLEQQLLHEILKPVIKDYDFIILDCAPGYNLLTRSALVSSDFYLLPARPEPLSLIGIQLLERRIEKLREAHQELGHAIKIKLLGVVFTLSGNLITGRYYQQVMRRVTEEFTTDKIFGTRIPVDVSVSKAVDGFTPVVISNPQSAGARAFTKLGQEFLAKMATATGERRSPTKVDFQDFE